MKLNEMTFLITGANGSVASVLVKRFTKKTAHVIGTIRKLSKNVHNNDRSTIIEMDPLDHYSIDSAIDWIFSEVGEINVWVNMQIYRILDRPV